MALSSPRFFFFFTRFLYLDCLYLLLLAFCSSSILILGLNYFTDYNLIFMAMQYQVNEKGQLRLSRRALLPDADPENANVRQPTGDSKDVASQETSSKDKIRTSKITSSPKNNSVESTLLPQKKFIRRSVSPAKDGLNINKDATEKSSSRVVSSLSSKGENSLVNGGANIGS